MLDRIIDIICEYGEEEKDNITVDSKLINDIGLSSFDITDLVCRFEEEFDIEIPDRKISTFQTVGDIYTYIKDNKKEE